MKHLFTRAKIKLYFKYQKMCIIAKHKNYGPEFKSNICYNQLEEIDCGIYFFPYFRFLWYWERAYDANCTEISRYSVSLYSDANRIKSELTYISILNSNFAHRSFCINSSRLKESAWRKYLRRKHRVCQRLRRLHLTIRPLTASVLPFFNILHLGLSFCLPYSRNAVVWIRNRLAPLSWIRNSLDDNATIDRDSTILISPSH